MSKVINKKEKYCTRSSISNKSVQAPKEARIDSESRTDFSVDTIGYFIWHPSHPQKKYNK